MALRPPPLATSALSSDTPLSALEYELMSEKADALARAGLRMEKALAALMACPPATENASERESLLNEAADIVWSFLVQREILRLSQPGRRDQALWHPARGIDPAGCRGQAFGMKAGLRQPLRHTVEFG